MGQPRKTVDQVYLFTTYNHSDFKRGLQPYYTFTGTEIGMLKYLDESYNTVVVNAVPISDSAKQHLSDRHYRYIGGN